MSITFDNLVTLDFDGIRFNYWTDIRISRSMDSFSTVEVNCPFDPNDRLQRDKFKPFMFRPLDVRVNDSPIFTGTTVHINPSVDESSITVQIGAFSRPGVLETACEPFSATKTQWLDSTFSQITKDLISNFGLSLVTNIPDVKRFKKIQKNVGAPIFGFLVELAQERGYILTDNPYGDLVAYVPDTDGESVATFKQSLSPLISINSNFSPESYFTEITGRKPIRVGAKKKTSYTLSQSLESGEIRPHVYDVPDVSDENIIDATKGAVGRMWGDVAQYTIEVATWRDSHGKLWSPGTFVTVEYPGVMIYRPYKFLIRDIILSRTDNTETAELKLILPGALRGQIEGALPWDE